MIAMTLATVLFEVLITFVFTNTAYTLVNADKITGQCNFRFAINLFILFLSFDLRRFGVLPLTSP